MLRLALVLPLLAAGCGLLERDPELPSLDRVRAARAAEEDQWQLLAEAWAVRASGSPEAAAELAALAQSPAGSLRLQALLQDFAVLDARTPGERQALALDAEEAALNQPSAGRYYLAARLADRGRALELLATALELDPELVPAQVLRLGLQARAGDQQPLEELVLLLDEHPGSAEGWRLLGQLAPFHARPELAVRAAETEPWLPLEDTRLDRLYRAEASLAAGEADLALASLRGLEDRHARLLRAAALAELGQGEAALELLQALVAERPDDAVAHFDLALLALDHLRRPALARRHLGKVLELAAAGSELPIQRLTQAELWLEQLPAAAGDGE